MSWFRDSSRNAFVPADMTKFEWLVWHARCPVCHGVRFSTSANALVCRGCGREYSYRDGTLNFIDPDTSGTFGVVETDNVSDHPFDGNAMAIIEKCRSSHGFVLDCGSGFKSNAFEHVIQMDIARFPNVDVLAVNQQLPFQDASFDAVFSLDVLEHVTDPFRSAAEIERVLKPGGVLYLDLPFLQAEHGYPEHYFNATRMGVKRLFLSLEFLDHIVPASGAPIFAIHQLLNVYREGLKGDARTRFDEMTVNDLLSRSPFEWLDDALVQELDAESSWQIASTTQAILRKPTSNVTLDSKLTIGPAELPGFAK